MRSPTFLTIGAFHSSDLWALGCVLYQMIAGRFAFQGLSEYLTWQKIKQLEYSFPEGFDEQGKDLVRRLLVRVPLLVPHPITFSHILTFVCNTGPGPAAALRRRSTRQRPRYECTASAPFLRADQLVDIMDGSRTATRDRLSSEGGADTRAG